MTKQEFVNKSNKIFKCKYDYKSVPDKVISSDYVFIGYKGLLFKQKVVYHLNGKCPEESRIRNTDDFINKSKLLWGHNKYDYSKSEFKGSTKPITLIYQGVEYRQIVNNHLCGYKCERMYTTDKFISDSVKIFKDRYDYSMVEYESMNKHVKIIYDGIIYEQTPAKHLMGRKPEFSCSSKLTKSEFISRSVKIFGDRYDYSMVDYVNMKTPVKIKFRERIYNQCPQYHLKGLRPEGLNVIDTETFIRKSVEIFKDRYDYSLVEYVDTDTPVKIKFRDIIYLQKPRYHLRGDRPEMRLLKKTTHQFISEANLIHEFRYKYEKSVYKKSNEKILITCPYHGDFEQTPNSHLSGVGCPECNHSKGEKGIMKFLNKYDITYSYKHKFEDCVNEKKLPFDFYIPSMRTCIEFDGIQHYQPVELFGGTTSYYLLRENDQIKNDYCEDNYINMVRIRYDEFDDIYSILWNTLGYHIRRLKLN